MLKNIPPIISPELLSVLNEMGHGDRICIGDGNSRVLLLPMRKGLFCFVPTAMECLNCLMLFFS